jgi:hypothetical protein
LCHGFPPRVIGRDISANGRCAVIAGK